MAKTNFDRPRQTQLPVGSRRLDPNWDWPEDEMEDREANELCVRDPQDAYFDRRYDDDVESAWVDNIVRAFEEVTE